MDFRIRNWTGEIKILFASFNSIFSSKTKIILELLNELVLFIGNVSKSCGALISFGPPFGAITLAQLHKKKIHIYIVCFIDVNINL